MNVDNMKRRISKNKSMAISIRISPYLSKWLKKKDLSPTGIFYEALKQIGYKEE